MRLRRAVLPLAWTLLACVLLAAGWAVYMITDPFAGQRQRALQDHLFQQWRSVPAVTLPAGTSGTGHSGTGTSTIGTDRGSPAQAQLAGRYLAPDRIRLVTGEPFALIRVPAFGRHWQFAIVQGTTLSQLALGPGHVPGTGLPGQRGNFVVAAHDVTAGNPFLHLRTLRHPDKVYVYTQTRVYEYVVRSERIVRYTDTGVEYPVPGHPGARPHRALITLITCTPETLGFTPWRVVVTGELARVSPRG